MFCHQTYYIPKVSIVVPFVGLDIDIAIFALRVLYKLPPQNRNYNGDFRHTYIYIYVSIPIQYYMQPEQTRNIHT